MAYPDSQVFDRLGRLLSDTGASLVQVYMAYGLLQRAYRRILYTPIVVQQTLTRADMGYFGEAIEMYRRMYTTDGHLRSVTGVRKLTGRRASLSIEPPDGHDDDPLAQITTDYAREVTSKLVGWTDLPYDLLEGQVVGFTALEIEWYGDVPIALWPTQPLDWRWQSGSMLGEPRAGSVGLLWRDARGTWQPTPQDKFIILTPDPSLIPAMRGGMRSCASSWAIKSVVKAVFGSYCELYGMPRTVVQIPDAKLKDSVYVGKLRAGIETMGSQGYSILTEAVKIVQWADGGKGGVAPHMECINAMDREMSKAHLYTSAATDNTGQTGSLASIEVFAEVRSDVAEADLTEVAETINGDLIEPMIRIAFGEGYPIPVVSFKLRNLKVEERELARLEGAQRLNIPIPLSHARAALSIPEPGEGEEVLGAPSTEGEGGDEQGDGSDNGSDGSDDGNG